MEETRIEMLRIFDSMLEKFPAIGIKYEFAKEYGCFLVSIDVADLNSEELEKFSELYLSSVRFLQDEFGDDAPLFCMNEEWFSLSKNAVYYHIGMEDLELPSTHDKSRKAALTNVNAPTIMFPYSRTYVSH